MPAIVNPNDVVWGKGYLYGGNTALVGDAVPYGELTEISLTDSVGVKELMGPGSLAAIAVGMSERKITGSAKNAKIRLNQFILARGGSMTISNAGILATTLSAATLIGANVFPVAAAAGYMTGDTITVDTAGNLETFTISSVDLANNLIITTAAATKTHALSCALNRAVGAGATRSKYTALSNDEPLMSTLHLLNPGDGSQFELKLYGVLIPKIALNLKLRDFSIADTDFQVYGDGTKLYELYLPGNQTTS